MTTRCPLCDGKTRTRFRVNGYRVVRCAACDLEFVDPIPSEAELARVYQRGYFAGGGFGYQDYFGRERADSDAKASVRVATLIELGARPGGRWLDVGCADGRFLLEAARRGFDVHGVETSAEARDRARAELNGRVSEHLDEALARGPFDTVTFWDVLEHLRDPFETLQRVRKALAPGALVGVVVPVIDNLNARISPHSWDQYKPPEHLWFFSRRALRSTIARTLDAEPVREASAWRRNARLFLPSLDDRSLRRFVGKAESAVWQGLCAGGLAPEHWFDDSVLLIARHR